MKTEKQKTARETAPFFFAVEKSGNVSRRPAATRKADKIASHDGQVDEHRAECDVTRSVSKMTEIERRGGKRWDKPKKAGKSRDCRGGKF